MQSILPEAFWARQWEAIEAGRNKGRSAVMWRRIAAAAVILITIGLSAYYFTQYTGKTGNEANTAAITTEFQTISNNLNEVQTILLSDGSAVELQPLAAVTFKEGFEKESRDIVLKGEATFSVAKDKTRPFTVYSGNITTTALGTKFRVAFKGDGKTSVHLYEGKVVVKAAQATNKKESYLMPGDILSYADNKISVVRTGEKSAVPGNETVKNATTQNTVKDVVREEKSKAIKSGKPIGTAIVPQWYRFEKESLANVFDQLAALYGVSIQYDAKKLKSKYFIGRFEQKNTIDNILNTIAELNRLQVEKIDDSHYQIK